MEKQSDFLFCYVNNVKVIGRRPEIVQNIPPIIGKSQLLKLKLDYKNKFEGIRSKRRIKTRISNKAINSPPQSRPLQEVIQEKVEKMLTQGEQRPTINNNLCSFPMKIEREREAKCRTMAKKCQSVIKERLPPQMGRGINRRILREAKNNIIELDPPISNNQNVPFEGGRYLLPSRDPSKKWRQLRVSQIDESTGRTTSLLTKERSTTPESLASISIGRGGSPKGGIKVHDYAHQGHIISTQTDTQNSFEGSKTPIAHSSLGIKGDSTTTSIRHPYSEYNNMAGSNNTCISFWKRSSSLLHSPLAISYSRSKGMGGRNQFNRRAIDSNSSTGDHCYSRKIRSKTRTNSSDKKELMSWLRELKELHEESPSDGQSELLRGVGHDPPRTEININININGIVPEAIVTRSEGYKNNNRTYYKTQEKNKRYLDLKTQQKRNGGRENREQRRVPKMGIISTSTGTSTSTSTSISTGIGTGTEGVPPHHSRAVQHPTSGMVGNSNNNNNSKEPPSPRKYYPQPTNWGQCNGEFAPAVRSKSVFSKHLITHPDLGGIRGMEFSPMRNLRRYNDDHTFNKTGREYGFGINVPAKSSAQRIPLIPPLRSTTNTGRIKEENNREINAIDGILEYRKEIVRETKNMREGDGSPIIEEYGHTQPVKNMLNLTGELGNNNNTNNNRRTSVLSRVGGLTTTNMNNISPNKQERGSEPSNGKPPNNQNKPPKKEQASILSVTARIPEAPALSCLPEEEGRTTNLPSRKNSRLTRGGRRADQPHSQIHILPFKDKWEHYFNDAACSPWEEEPDSK